MFAACKDRVMPRAAHPATRRPFNVCVTAAVLILTAACGSHADNSGSAAKNPGVHVPANFCGLLSGADITRVMGRTFPDAEGSQSPSEAQCAAIPTSGNDVTFKLYWNNLYCVEGKPADGQCLNAQSTGF